MDEKSRLLAIYNKLPNRNLNITEEEFDQADPEEIFEAIMDLLITA